MTEPQSPAEPLFLFHPAEFSLADHLGTMAILAVFGALFAGLPVKLAVAGKWPPETGLVVVWLVLGAIVWFLGRTLLGAWWSVRRGERAGLRLAEGEDYLEVAFFVGARAYQLQRFAYDEIVGCGVTTIVDVSGNARQRAYVATRGLMEGKSVLPLAIAYDARRICPSRVGAIAADAERIIQRHRAPASG